MTDMVVVPREPTEAMVRKAIALTPANVSRGDVEKVWSAMIASAPPVGEGMREKVARIIEPDAEHVAAFAEWESSRRAAKNDWDKALAKADAIIRLLSSGEA